MPMLVTEGKKSVSDRAFYLLAVPALFGAACAAFALVPRLARPVIWAGAAIGAGMALRHLGYSVAVRFMLPRKVQPAGGACPSIAFIIPCLNELPSLKATIPALTSLRYGGKLFFCYVCESASTDGTADFVKQWAQTDQRVVFIDKKTPPGGRGAAIKYGLAHAPRAEVVGFLDADHILRQESLDKLAAAFGSPEAPVALQGHCGSSNEARNLLTRLLTAERRWLERTELVVNPALGGMSQFGGGQGFFRRELLEQPQFAIDEDMILDDTDLSVRLVLAGYEVAYRPEVATESLNPETLGEFFDQRFRWGRGWLQVSRRYFWAFASRRPLSLAMRQDLLRFALIPYAGGVVFLSFAASAVGLAGAPVAAPQWAQLLALLWPFLLAPDPYVAGTGKARPVDLAVTLVGIPLLFYAYATFCAAALMDFYVFRRRVRYAKTRKRIHTAPGGPPPP